LVFLQQGLKARGYHKVSIPHPHPTRRYIILHLLPILLLTILIPPTCRGALLLLLRAPRRATRRPTHEIVARVAVGDRFLVVGAPRLRAQRVGIRGAGCVGFEEDGLNLFRAGGQRDGGVGGGGMVLVVRVVVPADFFGFSGCSCEWLAGLCIGWIGRLTFEQLFPPVLVRSSLLWLGAVKQHIGLCGSGPFPLFDWYHCDSFL
jgi:hypothetical protein